MSKTRKLAGLGIAAALAVGIAGQASAGAETLFCGYEADDGTSWTKSYVYPATRQCPSTSVRNGKEGELVWWEVIS